MAAPSASVWAIGDVTGVLMFTHVGKHQGRITAADIRGREARADYRAVPRVVFTAPQAAAVGRADGDQRGAARVADVPRTFTYEHPADRPSLLTLVAEGHVLVGAFAVGPEAREWIGQATVAIRAGVALDVLRDVIQPFPTFSEIFVKALDEICGPIGDCPTSAALAAAAPSPRRGRVPSPFPGA